MNISIKMNKYQNCEKKLKSRTLFVIDHHFRILRPILPKMYFDELFLEDIGPTVGGVKIKI